MLVYDKQCPVCDAYSRFVKIREEVGELRLVNAREPSATSREIADAGLSLDEGMVLKVGDVLYHGADAMHALALMGGRSGVFNRLNRWMFESAARSRVAYPLLSGCRKLLLRMLGRDSIAAQ